MRNFNVNAYRAKNNYAKKEMSYNKYFTRKGASVCNTQQADLMLGGYKNTNNFNVDQLKIQIFSDSKHAEVFSLPIVIGNLDLVKEHYSNVYDEEFFFFLYNEDSKEIYLFLSEVFFDFSMQNVSSALMRKNLLNNLDALRLVLKYVTRADRHTDLTHLRKFILDLVSDEAYMESFMD